jgi:hypothetical protein
MSGKLCKVRLGSKNNYFSLFRSREDLHLLLDGSSGTNFLFDKLVENGEAASLDNVADEQGRIFTKLSFFLIQVLAK